MIGQRKTLGLKVVVLLDFARLLMVVALVLFGGGREDDMGVLVERGGDDGAMMAAAEETAVAEEISVGEVGGGFEVQIRRPGGLTPSRVGARRTGGG